MTAALRRGHRLLKWILLALLVAAGIWWVGHVPYDPMAIYRPIPASATLVGRHLNLAGRWEEWQSNPLTGSLLASGGITGELAESLTADEESRRWFNILAGREGILAYRPARPGSAPAWFAVTFLGGHSQKLRWQLSLFRPPAYQRLKTFPRRMVWRVNVDGLEPGQNLVIAFGEGLLMACLSPDPLAIAEVLAGYDGNGRRLLAEEPSFSQFAVQDDRSVPDRFWIRNPRMLPGTPFSGIKVEIPRLQENKLRLKAVLAGGQMVPPAPEMAPSLEVPGQLLGNSPCLVARVHREGLYALLEQTELPRDVQFAMETAGQISSGPFVIAAMDGDFGGRLAWGVVRTLGLAGLRVPTVLVAAPAPEDPSAAIQRALDQSNARYRAAFVLRPTTAGATTLHVLESAGGNEWVDALAPADRPAYGLFGGWIVVASNLAALQKLARVAEARGDRYAASPRWMPPMMDTTTASLWMDLNRSGQVIRDAIATWSLVQMFLDREGSQSARNRLNDVRGWLDALAPLGEARLQLARRGDSTVLTVDLGLSDPAPTDTIPSL